jgi:hypothetical protein
MAASARWKASKAASMSISVPAGNVRPSVERPVSTLTLLAMAEED